MAKVRIKQTGQVIDMLTKEEYRALDISMMHRYDCECRFCKIANKLIEDQEIERLERWRKRRAELLFSTTE